MPVSVKCANNKQVMSDSRTPSKDTSLTAVYFVTIIPTVIVTIANQEQLQTLSIFTNKAAAYSNRVDEYSRHHRRKRSGTYVAQKTYRNLSHHSHHHIGQLHHIWLVRVNNHHFHMWTDQSCTLRNSCREIVKPQHSCAASVTCSCRMCLSVCCQPKSHCSRAMNRSTNNTRYSASGIGRKVCRVFSETAVFESYGVKHERKSQYARIRTERVRSLCVSWRHKKSQQKSCIDSRMVSTAVASQCQTLRELPVGDHEYNAY